VLPVRAEGEAGQIGVNSLRQRDGGMLRLGGCFDLRVESGEAIIIETPTGGGFGRRQ
jgi:5-oxoprolinase (ATP-hydrolysing)